MLDNATPLLDELSDGMGMAATLKLAAWRGGRRLFVPVQLPPDHELIARLGPEAALFMCERFGGVFLKVPAAAGHLRALRNARIQQEHADGKSLLSIAFDEGLDERQVCRIVATRAPERRQLALL